MRFENKLIIIIIIVILIVIAIAIVIIVIITTTCVNLSFLTAIVVHLHNCQGSDRI